MPRRTNTRERLITTAADLFCRQGYASHPSEVNVIDGPGTAAAAAYLFQEGVSPCWRLWIVGESTRHRGIRRNPHGCRRSRRPGVCRPGSLPPPPRGQQLRPRLAIRNSLCRTVAEPPAGSREIGRSFRCMDRPHAPHSRGHGRPVAAGDRPPRARGVHTQCCRGRDPPGPAAAASSLSIQQWQACAATSNCSRERNSPPSRPRLSPTSARGPQQHRRLESVVTNENEIRSLVAAVVDEVMSNGAPGHQGRNRDHRGRSRSRRVPAQGELSPSASGSRAGRWRTAAPTPPRPSTTPSSLTRSPSGSPRGRCRWGSSSTGPGIGSAMVANKVPGRARGPVLRRVLGAQQPRAQPRQRAHPRGRPDREAWPGRSSRPGWRPRGGGPARPPGGDDRRVDGATVAQPGGRS